MTIHDIGPTFEKVFDRVPPFNEGAEQAVLAAMMTDPDAISRATEILTEDMLFRTNHRVLFGTMVGMSNKGTAVDPLTLVDQLERDGQLGAAGGREFIAFLIDAVPTTANVEFHAKIVKDKALYRRMIEITNNLNNEAYTQKLDAGALWDIAESQIFTGSQSRGNEGFAQIRDLLGSAFERIKETQKHGRSVTGVPTGFVDLDEMTTGLQPADLVIIAARPSMGKCLAADSQIVLTTGEIKTIAEVFQDKVGDILTLLPTGRIASAKPSNFIDDGEKPAFRITTATGRQVITTLTHPFLRIDGWVPLSAIEVGDYIAVPRVIPVFGSKPLGTAEIKILAYLLGDGTVSHGGTAMFTNRNPLVQKDFAEAVASFGNGDVEVSAVTTGWRAPTVRVRKTGTRNTRISNPVTVWLKELGVWGHKAGTKVIPSRVFQAPRSEVALFLNRLFATDGWAAMKTDAWVQIGFCSVSEVMARQVQHLLLRFGIISTIRKKKVNYKNEQRSAWQVLITNPDTIISFAEKIGIFGKEEALSAVVNQINRKRMRPGLDRLPMEVWRKVEAAKGVESWASLLSRSGVPGGKPYKRKLSRVQLASLAKSLDNQDMLRLATSDVLWDKVVSIEPLGNMRVFDLTVPITHNFIANDICVHNTSLVMNIAEHAAIAKGIGVAFFSLEMSKDQLVTRLLTSEGRIDAQRLRKGQLHDDEMHSLGRAAGILAQAPIFIDDTPGISILEARSKARRLKAEHNVGLVVVDYLQLMQGEKSESRQQEVSSISRGLKALAKELKVPVIALSQLSRNTEQRTGDSKRPQLSDLRESGAIEQDADIVMFIYREEVYAEKEDGVLKDPSLEGKAEIIVGKQRNGPIGFVNLFFQKQYTRFENVVHHHVGGAPPASDDPW